MTVIAVAEAVALVAIVYLMLRSQRANDVAWTAERRELLTRIQRPELLPAPTGQPFVWPDDVEPDDIGLVGTIAELASEDGNQ